jgi:valyl-tRNA synthetase
MAWENSHGRADHAVWEPQIKRLAMAGQIRIEPKLQTARGWVPFVFDGGKGGVHVGQAIDLAKERRRIEQELAQLRSQFGQLETRLQDEAFRSKAPEDVLVREQDRRRQLLQRIETLESYLNTL